LCDISHRTGKAATTKRQKRTVERGLNAVINLSQERFINDSLIKGGIVKKTLEISLTGTFVILLVCSCLITGQELAAQTGTTKTVQKTTTQTKTAPVQKKTVPAQKKTAQPQKKPSASKPATKPLVKAPEAGTLKIGLQIWAAANLNVVTFRNGDTIPEARTNEEWVAAGKAGKPAWCNYNNDPKHGQKYGKLYNWYAVTDPRGLAPKGWSLPDAADWNQLAGQLGGAGKAGNKLKSSSGWADGFIGTNESGFNGLPGGYRVENGTFLNLGSIATWWSTDEGKPGTAVDHYLGQRGSLETSNNPKSSGESVRCIRKN